MPDAGFVHGLPAFGLPRCGAMHASLPGIRRRHVATPRNARAVLHARAKNEGPRTRPFARITIAIAYFPPAAAFTGAASAVTGAAFFTHFASHSSVSANMCRTDSRAR